MTVNINDRPSDQVKEEVIDTLVHNFSHGVISEEAFERRLDKVLNAKDNQSMMDEIADLEAVPDNRVKEERESHFAVKYANEACDENATFINIMGGSDQKGSWIVPKKITSISIMGGATIDFSEARFSSPKTTLTSIAIMGGDDIYVPTNVNVVSKVFCLMGGFDNKAPSLGGPNAPTITIRGFALWGGSSVKIRKSMKEKFLALARQLKEGV